MMFECRRLWHDWLSLYRPLYMSSVTGTRPPAHLAHSGDTRKELIVFTLSLSSCIQYSVYVSGAFHVSPITDKMSLLSEVNIDDWNFWLSGLHLIKFLASPSDVIFNPITDWVMGPFSSGDLTSNSQALCDANCGPFLNTHCYQVSIFWYEDFILTVWQLMFLESFCVLFYLPSWHECLVVVWSNCLISSNLPRFLMKGSNCQRV